MSSHMDFEIAATDGKARTGKMSFPRGEVATPADAQEVCGAIRGRLAELYDAELADGVRILYGGSVKSGSIAQLMAEPDVDGGLVGGASLDPEEFAKIVRFKAHAA